MYGDGNMCSPNTFLLMGYLAYILYGIFTYIVLIGMVNVGHIHGSYGFYYVLLVG